MSACRDGEGSGGGIAAAESAEESAGRPELKVWERARDEAAAAGGLRRRPASLPRRWLSPASWSRGWADRVPPRPAPTCPAGTPTGGRVGVGRGGCCLRGCRSAVTGSAGSGASLAPGSPRHPRVAGGEAGAAAPRADPPCSLPPSLSPLGSAGEAEASGAGEPPRRAGRRGAGGVRHVLCGRSGAETCSPVRRLAARLRVAVIGLGGQCPAGVLPCPALPCLPGVAARRRAGSSEQATSTGRKSRSSGGASGLTHK